MNADLGELLHRTVGCGDVTLERGAAGGEVVLTGWVHRRRDLGQLIFVELRDRTGLVQVVFDPSASGAAHAAAEGLRNEDVIGVRGLLVPRQSPNPEHETGTLELRASALVIHNKATFVPLPVDDVLEAHEEARLTHRYVDLRRPRAQQRLRLRHRLAAAARRVLDGRGFIEVETPLLTRSTPEGARDYLVPSRIHPGRLYALPQSPQLFKQLLMIAGFDRYYQFARCFRDEDLRADRQPEFTQVDIEVSFATPQTIYEEVELLMAEMFREIGVDIPRPFARMPHAEAIERFGSDRPDLRFGLELRDAGEGAQGSGFRLFDEVLERGGAVRGFAVPGGADGSRKVFDEWTARAKAGGAAGLVWMRWGADGTLASPALKALGEERCARIARAVGAAAGDAALVIADRREVANAALGALRLHIGAERQLVPAGVWNLTWVEDFPLFEWDAALGRWFACHHPFTAPRWEEVDLLASEPGRVRAQAYDLVLNGVEIGGGSIRIHRRDVQEKVFSTLSIGEEEALEKFGFLLRALESGAPPHGGIALGFDRISAMLSGADSIREVIAFPKTTSAACLMTGAPSEVDAKQLAELGLALRQGVKP